MKRIVFAVILAGAALHAAAASAPIYRCGSTYSQDPCPGGKLLDVSDPRTAAQRAEAKKVAAAERRRAAELERERRARQSAEKASAPKGAASDAGKGKKKQVKAARIVPLKPAS
jgi:hypothetical protein